MVAEVRGRRGGKQGGAATAAATGGPDARQVDVLLAELLRMCQLAEEYNGFMLAKMRDGGQLTAARETNFRCKAFLSIAKCPC